MGKIKLRNSIFVNGMSVDEMEYDISEITAEDFVEAGTNAGIAANRIMELNAALHKELGMFSVVKMNQDIDMTDLARVTGRDIVQFARIGREMFSPEDGIEVGKDTLFLKHGLNGKKEVRYDLESITVEQFDDAYEQGGVVAQKVMEINEAFHLYLGAYAVANAEGMKVDDVVRGLRGKDVIVVATMGRDFFTGSAEDTEETEDILQPSSCEEPSDPTQGYTTVESETSEEGL